MTVAEKAPIHFPQFDCSFCGKTNLQAEFLIAGPPNANICESCVETCAEILESRKKKHFDYVTMLRES